MNLKRGRIPRRSMLGMAYMAYGIPYFFFKEWLSLLFETRVLALRSCPANCRPTFRSEASLNPPHIHKFQQSVIDNGIVQEITLAELQGRVSYLDCPTA